MTDLDPLDVCDKRVSHYINAYEYCAKYGINKAGLVKLIEQAEKIKKIKVRIENGDT
jgi:hypothetical protein